jgi:hypothetical protein
MSEEDIKIDAPSLDQCGQEQDVQDYSPSHVLNKEEYMKAFEKVLLRQKHIHRLDRLNVSDTQRPSPVMAISSPMNVRTINTDDPHSCSSRKRHKVSSSSDHSPMLPLHQPSSSFKSIGDEGDIIMSTTSTGDEDDASTSCSDEDDASTSCSDEDDASSSCSEVSLTVFIIETLF